MENIEDNYTCCDPGMIFSKLRFGIYRFTYNIQGPNKLSGYLGSAWRGVFCRTLQKNVCTERRVCSQCPSAGECLYYCLVEQKSNHPGYDTPPRPYVIRPAGCSARNVSVDIVLINQDDSATIHCVSSFRDIYHLGWRGKKTSLKLSGISQMQPDESWQMILSDNTSLNMSHTSWLLKDYLDQTQKNPHSWNIRFVTPIRLEKKNQPLRLIPWDWTFERFANRLAELEGEMPDKGQKKWIHDKLRPFFHDYGTVQDDINWQDMHRYSSRQKKKHPIGGLRGTGLVVPPKGKEGLWYRWWQSAALLHLGKKTTIGHGKIKITSIGTMLDS